jgi:hypothetical protein
VPDLPDAHYQLWVPALTSTQLLHPMLLAQRRYIRRHTGTRCWVCQRKKKSRISPAA